MFTMLILGLGNAANAQGMAIDNAAAFHGNWVAEHGGAMTVSGSADSPYTMLATGKGQYSTYSLTCQVEGWNLVRCSGVGTNTQSGDTYDGKYTWTLSEEGHTITSQWSVTYRGSGQNFTGISTLKKQG